MKSFRKGFLIGVQYVCAGICFGVGFEIGTSTVKEIRNKI